ncbi:hypothetical protein G7074_10105 [Pedobacter sp. HDW13]|uniref:hypothetical protein n=1 Tax=unclassified Pedobacter TaxID=2628915 RepID=UPI000F59D65A|nr:MULTISPECIES: hypothetical protein [unclassified Pedobacter]QIL39596.1 hypothetical protein G7074_10105 [Pedobacter sp. HDW13]
MRAFRIFLVLVAAGATFYSLNVLAVQNGYRDRLDFRNRYYHEHDCRPEQKSHAFNHHSNNTTSAFEFKPEATQHIVPVK